METRVCYRFDMLKREWVLIEMSELKDGDIFILYEGGERYHDEKNKHNVWVAEGDAYESVPGVWAIKSMY